MNKNWAMWGSLLIVGIAGVLLISSLYKATNPELSTLIDIVSSVFAGLYSVMIFIGYDRDKERTASEDKG